MMLKDPIHYSFRDRAEKTSEIWNMCVVSNVFIEWIEVQSSVSWNACYYMYEHICKKQRTSNFIKLIWNQWSGNHLIFTRNFMLFIDYFPLKLYIKTMFDTDNDFRAVPLFHIFSPFWIRKKLKINISISIHVPHTRPHFLFKE